jgi:ubiquinone/menaquinone biosynthesis C-methylase UbiE
VTDCYLDCAQSPAEVYEDFLVRWQFRPWTAVLLAEAAIRPGERILDLATGTGIVAREAAAFVGERGRVVALDINPAMMAVGQSLPEPAGASIEWLEGDAAALPLPDAAFDVVLCQQGLQYFANRPAAAAEVRRVLTSGGRALLAVWRALAHNPVQEALNAAGQCRVGVAPLATAFGLGDAGELGRLFESAGFTDARVTERELVVVFPSRADFTRRMVESVAHVVPELAGLDSLQRAELASAIDEDVRATLQSHAWGGGLASPMAAHLIQARTGSRLRRPGSIRSHCLATTHVSSRQLCSGTKPRSSRARVLLHAEAVPGSGARISVVGRSARRSSSVGSLRRVSFAVMLKAAKPVTLASNPRRKARAASRTST